MHRRSPPRWRNSASSRKFESRRRTKRPPYLLQILATVRSRSAPEGLYHDCRALERPERHGRCAGVRAGDRLPAAFGYVRRRGHFLVAADAERRRSGGDPRCGRGGAACRENFRTGGCGSCARELRRFSTKIALVLRATMRNSTRSSPSNLICKGNIAYGRLLHMPTIIRMMSAVSSAFMRRDAMWRA